MSNKTIWLERLKTEMESDIKFYEDRIIEINNELDRAGQNAFLTGLLTAYEVASERARRIMKLKVLEYIKEDLED